MWGMRVVIENLSDMPRTNWVRCAFPVAKVESHSHECRVIADDGRHFRAVRGEQIGSHSQIYRIEAVLNGSEKVGGDLVDGVFDTMAFSAHPWALDDPADLLMSAEIQVDGEILSTSSQSPIITLQNKSLAHQLFHFISATEEHGFRFEWWLEILHKDPVARCWGRLTWGDGSDPNEHIRIQGVALSCGEFYVDDFARQKGMSGPVFADGKWRISASGPRWMVDGSGLDFQGQLLMMAAREAPDATAWHELEDGPGWGAESIRSLNAAWRGKPVVALCEEWNGRWLAAQNEPRCSWAELDAEFRLEWAAHQAKEIAGGDFYDPRPLGVGQNPPGAGGKEDFGATKGSYAISLGEPRALQMLDYSATQDVYRAGTTLSRGGILDPEVIGGEWLTWTGYTHYHPGVSPERLGKTANAFGFPNLDITGWVGMDDQHRSQNGLAAAYALSGSPLLRSILEGFTITDTAMVPNRVGAARAIGRLLGAWAQYALLLDDGIARRRIMMAAGQKLDLALAAPEMTVTGPVRVIAHGEPDPRKLVYDYDGKPARWWSVWEHGLAAVGLSNFYKATDDERALQLLSTICRTVIERALFVHEGTWYLPDDIYWREDGQALENASWTPESEQLVVSPGIGGTTGWAFCAVLIGAEILSGPTADRAKEAIEQIVPGELVASDRITAEWWACVPG